MSDFKPTEKFAKSLDLHDPLAKYRKLFHIPKFKSHDCLYFAGNSLGLQPNKTQTYIEQELKDWASLGVEGHFHAKNPWYPYHESLTLMTANLVGAKSNEVVNMNSLTVNLHLMLVSFYRPTRERSKILIEKGAFPSDHYAVNSQAKFHGHDPSHTVLEISPRSGEHTIRKEDLLSLIEKEGRSIALILLGNVNYLTGQAFDLRAISEAGHAHGCFVGFDLAHGAGNLEMHLHDWDVDFAVWCSYKYLNAGPGGIAGCFVHERHGLGKTLTRFEGWWGHNKIKRFEMAPVFDPIAGAEAWQLSNPPIFQMAALRASLEIFEAAGMSAIREKSVQLTGYLEFLLEHFLGDSIALVTPRDPEQRGAHLSYQISGKINGQISGKLDGGIKGGFAGKSLVEELKSKGIHCDFREPDILRVAPVPLYNSYNDVFLFAKELAAIVKG